MTASDVDPVGLHGKFNIEVQASSEPRSVRRSLVNPNEVDRIDGPPCTLSPVFDADC